MQQYGVRRLLILSGQAQWCRQQALGFTRQYSGDWLWIADTPLSDYPQLQRKPEAVQNLLGSEFHHAVFDACEGFNAEALIAVSGTLSSGSLLVLLLPEWSSLERQPDNDSLRWSEAPEPICTPHFIQHIKRQLNADSDVLFWPQNGEFTGQLLAERKVWMVPDGSPTEEQQHLLENLLRADTGTYVLIAGRGRGKSALAGMLAAQWTGKGECWLTAPVQASGNTLQQWANGKISFWAPDALLERCQAELPKNVDWLIIDEAAAIPAPQLYRLIACFPRVLLTTTVQGYEGSGRGFLLKFCAGLKDMHLLNLQQPIRWAENDPLERCIHQLLLVEAENSLSEKPGKLQQIIEINQHQLADNEKLFNQFYGLLTSAHYRTTPLDLRRLFDAPGLSFSVGLDEKQSVIAALWLVDEGGLSPDLAREVWAGRRRPRGNLVAQSLAAHGAEYLAPQLRSARISRIAVVSAMRRQGIARALIVQQIERAKLRGLDYLSVSFGYTEELWQFWQACGFELIHMGSHQEASSGCYAAMAIVPFSQDAVLLARRAKRQFLLNQLLPCVKLHHVNDIAPAELAEEDWRELAGFAFAHRTLEASQVSLYRLLRHQAAICCCLRQLLEGQTTAELLVKESNLNGRKALLQLWRQEVAEALLALNSAKYHYWQNWVAAQLPVISPAA
ncbi:tRNA(Met) cytidine acetyltransferase [Budviciaceae bacterium CWB-B4]|uniref:tRNA(Met) cytidine acetyltransferase TmcA n=2 Tax=Limnobaculum xujianqingii TaxID=2738837 RepID=A0A9D7AL33_9GAMM|nr:tRNA(Met) cytidine acetyltransferase [Limnobaculum xujianqingii]MBK5177870.1 tRNA(Met) cytidine acetyltransferase [Limnobaculum xujianqingii]